jgi:hypothetical protein
MFDTIRSHTIYASSLQTDSVVVDFGANRGEFARRMDERYGGRYYLDSGKCASRGGEIRSAVEPVRQFLDSPEPGIFLHINSRLGSHLR